jgi:hypothetical protein
MSNDSLKKLVSDLTSSGERPERKGITIYLPKTQFEEIEALRNEYDLTRQDLVSQLIAVGLESFKAELKKKKR